MLYFVQQTQPNSRNDGMREGQLSENIISPLIKKKQKQRKIEQRKKCVRLSKAFKWTAL
jgi:hypothetical protein